jgi:hypothetical protein
MRSKDMGASAPGAAPEGVAPAMGPDEVLQKPLSAHDLATSLARVLAAAAPLRDF